MSSYLGELFTRQIENNRRDLVHDALCRYDDSLRPFTYDLDCFLAILFEKRLPADWREQWHAFVADQAAKGYFVEPVSDREMEAWIEAWARYCELLPHVQAQSPAATAARTTAVDRFTNIRPTQRDISEQFFDEKLAAAQRHLDEIERLLQGLGQRLDAAKMRQEVYIDAEVDSIEELIWSYNNALESARDAWLRENLSDDADVRLSKMLTPLSFGLPLFTDDDQARRARAQEMEISRRLHQRNVTMDRIVAGAQAVEMAGTGSSIALGGGMLITAFRYGGKWGVVKVVATAGAAYVADDVAGRALNTVGVDEQTIRGVQLAAAVVKLILLRRGKSARPVESPSRAVPESTPNPGPAGLKPTPSPSPTGTGLVATAPVGLGQWGELRLKQVLGGDGAAGVVTGNVDDMSSHLGIQVNLFDESGNSIGVLMADYGAKGWRGPGGPGILDVMFGTQGQLTLKFQPNGHLGRGRPIEGGADAAAAIVEWVLAQGGHEMGWLRSEIAAGRSGWVLDTVGPWQNYHVVGGNSRCFALEAARQGRPPRPAWNPGPDPPWQGSFGPGHRW